MAISPLLSSSDRATQTAAGEQGFLAGIPGFSFADLFSPVRLRDLYGVFETALAEADPGLASRYTGWRDAPDLVPAVEASEIMVAVAPHVSRFLARLFRLEEEREMLREGFHAHDPVFRFKLELVRRRALVRFKTAQGLDPALVAQGDRIIAALRRHPAWPFDPPRPAGAEVWRTRGTLPGLARLSVSGTSISPLGAVGTARFAPVAPLPPARSLAESCAAEPGAARDAEGEIARFACLLLDADGERAAGIPLSPAFASRLAAVRHQLSSSDHAPEAPPENESTSRPEAPEVRPENSITRTPNVPGRVSAGATASANSVGSEFVAGYGIEPAGGAGSTFSTQDSAGKAGAAPEGTQSAIRTSHDLPGLAESEAPAGAADAQLVASLLAALEAWSAARVHDPRLRAEVRDWVSFRFPEPVHHEALVQFQRPRPDDLPEMLLGPDDRLRRRDGFALTDARMGRREVLSEVHYCIYCHNRDKDSCAKGIRTKEGPYKKNPLGILLEGCPLDEKISEAHLLAKQGDPIASLALIAIDNPMCPGTGHRICNDCMKACIYQSQDPVNIPQIETGLLTDVLRLRWGVEIYGLLTRWNPLNVRRPYALPYNGKNILVVGLGPAGYTLAHHLLNEGFGVVGIDGLKIEPLPAEMTGDPGRGLSPRPIESWSAIYRPLDRRILEGFGGVSEYGITVRWDKNFLTLLHLTLARRETLRIFGGVRFGGTLALDDAWALGFDHVAIASGAGKPTVIDMKNNLIRGIRKASDFLMALQLTGAAKKDTLANLQARLPALVIGGGLTAIDTATELAAYYPLQVEKLLYRYQQIVAKGGSDRIWRALDHEETEILQEFLAHGREIMEERKRAEVAGEKPDFVKLVRAWGGVSIAYRKNLSDSPAYRLNHEEVIKSLEEGIAYIECLDPEEALADRHGALRAVVFRQQEVQAGKWVAGDRTVTLPARSMMVAAGTSPNITYEKEHQGSFALDSKGRFFLGHHAVRGEDGRFHAVPAPPGETAFFTSYEKEGRLVSFYGDNHPVFAGNVVKAMASAKQGFGYIAAIFAEETAPLSPADQPARDRAFSRFAANLEEELTVRVHAVVRLTPTIIEVIVKAPLAARKFHPGQFYRLQNYETVSPLVAGTRLMMEGLALTGAWVDRERGLLSLIVLEMGASSRLCATLQPGERVVVMGPTGSPTFIPHGESVLLAGGGLGNAVLFSIARAMRDSGNRVIYFAGYKRGEDLFKREEIEAACDQVIWSTDAGSEIVPSRQQDKHFRGNIVQAIKSYGDGLLGETHIPLATIDRIIAIGSDRMMNAVKEARKAVLAPYLKKDHVAIGSINSSMQCMMKEVCAQCLQKHVDPLTGEETSPVFSCFNQDQELDTVDFQNLNNRLRMNSVQEKLTNLWLDHVRATAAS